MAQTNSRKYQMRSSPIRGLSQQALGHFFSLFLYLYFCFVFVILKWYARLSSWYFWNHECSLFMQENNSENENGHKPTSETESNAKIRDVKNSTRKKQARASKLVYHWSPRITLSLPMNSTWTNLNLINMDVSCYIYVL